VGVSCDTHRIMSQSVRTKSKPPRASGPPAVDRFLTGERLGKLETEVAYIKEDIAEIKNNMTTKADIAALRESMDLSRESTKAEIASLKESTKAEIASLKESTKAEIASLKESTKADLVKTENRILRWIVGSMGTLIIAILGLIVAFVLRSL